MWPATVELIENLGAESHVDARSDVAGPLVVRMPGSLDVKVGDKSVFLQLKGLFTDLIEMVVRYADESP